MVGRLARSFAFACMNAYVVGCLLFINGARAAVGTGVVAFALGYIGHIVMILDAIRSDFAQIARSKAALRAWSSRNAARGMFRRLDQNSDGERFSARQEPPSSPRVVCARPQTPPPRSER